MKEFDRLEIKSLAELRDWLARNHSQTEAVWLVSFKKSESELHVPYAEVVDELLCWGWIDSTPRKLDERRSMILIANRKPASRWSKVNKDKVARMLAEGRMQASGIAKVELAKATGTWDALNDVDALNEPDDLRTALESRPDARRFWEQFPPSTRRGILEWILAAKTEPTRARRIAETADLASQNIRANQPRQPKRSQKTP